MYNNNQFMFAAASAGANAKKLLEESASIQQPTIGADTYNEPALEAKLGNDGRFFMGLTSVLEESEKDTYFEQLSVLLEATQDIFIEVNMKPRTISQAVDTQELTESTVMEIYSKNFTNSVNKDFALPLFEGTLLADYKSEARILTEASIQSGLSSEINNELFLKYALFENTLFTNMRRIALPKILEERTASFIAVQDAEYFDVFTKNAKALDDTITESVTNMVAMLAPKLFEESTGLTDSGVKNFAGISKALR
jgi:hypothetical protein